MRVWGCRRCGVVTSDIEVRKQWCRDCCEVESYYKHLVRQDTYRAARVELLTERTRLWRLADPERARASARAASARYRAKRQKAA